MSVPKTEQVLAENLIAGEDTILQGEYPQKVIEVGPYEGTIRVLLLGVTNLKGPAYHWSYFSLDKFVTRIVRDEQATGG